MIRFVSHPSILEAIYVASPELYDSFTGLIEGRTKTGGDKLLKTLYKYLVRMTSRSTPYGLFAGCAIGTLGKETRIEFNADVPYYTHSRLDMNYVAELATGLIKKQSVRDQLLFSVNTSLYRIGDTYRYVESFLKNKKRVYVLASVEANEYLDRLLAQARVGATIREMVNVIVSDEISEQEATHYVNAVIDAQIVVSDLEATVTGDEFFNRIINRLEKLNDTAEDVFQLKRIASLLKLPKPGVVKYKEVESVISNNFVTTGSKDLIQTDLFYNTHSCQLGEQVISLLTKEYKQIEFLGYRNPQPEMDQFRRSFFEKYEQREMPLLEVLDNETGIGYGKATAGRADHLPLLDEMQLPGNVKLDTTEWSPLVRFKEKLYKKAIAEGKKTVSLTDAMLNELRQNVPLVNSAPHSFYLFGNLIADSQQELDKGNFKFAFQAMGGPSGLKLFGRFCHGNPTLTTLVREALLEEECCEPDAIFAEIAHLPEARVGNVLMRPHFRTYEIPYLAGSSLPTDYQITPDDLMVSVSGSGEVILRSKRLNKRVYPRLTNAHNFASGLPVYRFLCELNYQNDYQYLGWSWNFLAANTFLPRVEYKHWILSRATWNFDKEVFARLLGKDVAYISEWRKIRDSFDIPRFVLLLQGDSELLIDGDAEISVQILADAMRKHGKISLTEFLEGQGKGVLNEGEKRYVNEILIPLLNEKNKTPSPDIVVRQIPAPRQVKRTFIVGSEWLYVKIYAGTKTADRLLTSLIKPLVEELLATQTIEKWFYIRFADPDDHLRVRFFNGTQPGFWNTVLERLNQLLYPMLENGMVQRVQIDTYKRELERYGHYEFEQVESIFFADSTATVGLLDRLEGDEGERYRWLLGLRSVDMLLDDLNFGLAEKKRLMDGLQENFFNEFKGSTQLTIQLNNKYRAHTKEIANFMNAHQDASNEIEAVIELMNERSICIRDAMSRIFPRMTVPKHSFAASLIHMFLNRLFVSKQRVHELVIYHYLKKYYESSLARQKKNSIQPLLQEH